jgi:hypothetical protein
MRWVEDALVKTEYFSTVMILDREGNIVMLKVGSNIYLSLTGGQLRMRPGALHFFGRLAHGFLCDCHWLSPIDSI